MIADDHAFAERVRNLIPINGLDARLQAQALAQGELLEFRKKKTVFEVGARDPYTFYLLDGELELQAKESSPLRMSAGDENARRALAQLQPRRYTAVAVTPVSVFRIERAVLDHILADEQMLEDSTAQVMDVRELEDDDEEDDSDWMSRLLSSELFTRLPHENIQRFFSELEPLEAEKDAVVVEQGTSGDFLYIVAEGRCAVVRRAPGGGQEAQLAILKEGDTFGEESLISNSPRNASVRMISDGMLMRLPKAAFEELVSNPTLKAVPWSEASKLVENGALWVDVRFADEHQSDGIEGSINAPLNALRQQAGGLDRERKYIVYCDSGARSSAGAFLMARLGFDTCYLAGGLERSPLGAPSSTTSAQPMASDDDGLSDATAGAFEFEFTSAGDTVEDEVIAGADDLDDGDGDGEASTGAPLDSTAETVPAPPAQAPAAEAPAPPRTAQQPAPADGQHPQMAKARAALVALKAERDKAAAYGKKAADAAREYKQRNEELNKAVQSERERREQLDKELAAAKADAERRASMEQTRLSGELEKAGKRIDALQAERDQAQQRAAEDLAKLQALVDDNDARLDAVVKDKEEAAAMHVSAEAAFQDLLQNVQSDAKAAEARAQSIEIELKQARDRLVELEARDQDAAQQQLAATSEIKIGLAQTQARIEEERKQLDLDRAQLNDELRKMRDEQQQAQDRLLAERAALENEVAKAHTRSEALDQREIELTDARDAVDQTLQQREQSLVDREAALAQRDQALSDEKSLWQQTVDKAIADERARLESEHARFRQETEALTEQRLQAMLEEKTQELNAEHEEQQTQMRGQVEAHVAKLLAEFDARLATVRNGYETQLSEQEAMLEDERRRLETEIVRLREALADARQAVAPVAPVAHTPVLEREIELPPAQAADAPALDFELNESAASTIKSDEPTAADTSVAPTADVDLELQIDEPDDESEARTEVPEVPTLEIDVPLIEMPQLEETEAAFDGKPSEKRDRVISTNQLAEIRARMQEKMRAAKSKAG